jgi:hypothetical protein
MAVVREPVVAVASPRGSKSFAQLGATVSLRAHVVKQGRVKIGEAQEHRAMVRDFDWYG